MRFGEYLKHRRILMGLSARKFAAAKGYDVGYISRLENGLIAPPANESKVQALGEALGLEKGTPEWQDYLDMVAIARNEVPKDLRENEQAAKLLLTFYKSLRSSELTEEEIVKLINLIGGSKKNHAVEK